MTVRCPICRGYQEFDSIELPNKRCDDCNSDLSKPHVRSEVIEVSPRTATPPTLTGEGVVYYLQFGDRYKIGFSTNLPSRLNSLPYDKLLAVEPGSFELERRRHATFSRTRVDGQNEWFHQSPALLFHIATLEDLYGNPWKAAQTVALNKTISERSVNE